MIEYPVRKHPFPTLGFTTPHMTDARVAASHDMLGCVTEAQNLLHGYGGGHFGEFHPGKVDGNYGAKSAHASRAAKYFLGYKRVQVNGHFAPELRSHLLPPTHEQHVRLTVGQRLRSLHRKRLAAQGKYKRWYKPPVSEASGLGLKMYEIAVTQLGIKEFPFASNRVKYTEWYGLIGPWCAMFLSWCAHQAGSKEALAGSRWAAVELIYEDAVNGRNGLHVIPNDRVRRGDWVPLHFTENFQHVEIFDHWVDEGRGIFATIGGNTGPAGPSDGGEVARGTRTVSEIHLFCRLEG